MLKKHMAACLVATAFAAVPALAQTSGTTSSGATDRPVATGSGSTTTGSPAMQPNPSGGMQPGATGSSSSNTGASSTMGASSNTGTSAMANTGGQGQFMTQMQSSQLMASKLIGTTVVGANNESIGDVNDVILDRNGQAMAVVIGVGGFLGIGEKDVAVTFNELEFAANPMTASSTGGAVSGSGQNTASGNNVNTTGSTAGAGAASNRSTATTGNTGSGDPNTNSTASNDGGVPDRIVLRMTKEELQSAPSFQSNASESASTGATGSSGTGTTAPTAPKQ